MYSFYVNIGSWTSPVKDSGYILAHPFYEKAKLIKAKDGESLRYTTKLQGSLIFHDNEAIQLKALSANHLNVGLKVVYNSSDIWEGSLQLIGKYNTQADLCELEATENATLYSKIKAGLSKTWPPIDTTVNQATVTFSFTTWLDEIGQAFEKGTSGANVPPDYYGLLESAITVVNDWSDSIEYGVATNISGTLWQGHYRTVPTQLPALMYDGTCFVKKNSKYFVCILADNIGKDPETETTYWKEIENSATDFIYYTQERSYFQNDGEDFTQDIYLTGSKLWYRSNTAAGTYQNTLARCQGVFNILQSILSKIDSNIEIYETTSGLNTGFCPYLESYYSTGHLYYHWDSVDEITPISLQSIIDFMKVAFNVDWKLEGNKFVFRHVSEYPTTVGSTDPYDLTAYLGKDWTIWDEDTKIEDKVYKEEFKFDNQSTRNDFFTQELIFNNNYENVKTNSVNYKTDFVEIFNDGGDAFLYCHTELGVLTLSEKNGLINSTDKYNGYLAMSNCFYDHHRTGGRPFAKGTLSNNNTEYTLTKKKNTTINMKVPYLEPDVIDPENYLVETSNGNLQVEEININLADGMADVKAVK